MVGKDAENFDPSEVMLVGNDSLTRQDIQEYLESRGETVLLCDGFDDAFIGLSQRINEPLCAVYSYEKMVDVLIKRDGMDYEEASEYVDFNVVGAWVGKQTPIIVMPLD
jgi:hypothetical protein